MFLLKYMFQVMRDDRMKLKILLQKMNMLGTVERSQKDLEKRFFLSSEILK